MSKLFNRIADTIECNINDSDVVNLWNRYADDNSYEEHIYSMGEFNEIVDGNRPYNEVQEEMDDDFDNSKDYFYVDSGTGYFTSTDDPFDVVDVTALAQQVYEDRGLYGGLTIDEIDSIFDGFDFENEMKEIIGKLSDEEVASVIKAFQDYDAGYESLEKDGIADVLWEYLDNEDHEIVYMMPEAIQSKYFEFVDPNLAYLNSMVGVKGPVPPQKALELAGFEKMKNDHYTFVSDRGKAKWYEIKIKGDKVSSVKESDREHAVEAAR